MNDMEEETEESRIVGVAIKHDDCRMLSMPRPFRHDAVIHRAVQIFGVKTINSEWKQGFVDQYGNFYTRKQALRIAKVAGQVDDSEGPRVEILMSEDLW